MTALSTEWPSSGSLEKDSQRHLICICSMLKNIPFHGPVTLRAPLNRLLWKALYKCPYKITLFHLFLLSNSDSTVQCTASTANLHCLKKLVVSNRDSNPITYLNNVSISKDTCTAQTHKHSIVNSIELASKWFLLQITVFCEQNTTHSWWS